MGRDRLCFSAETALIHALAFLRDGQTELALEMSIVAVGRIGALVPEAALNRVSTTIADRVIAARNNDEASPG